MDTYYTSERNAQIVIFLLKAHGIRKVITSPGSTNVCLVASMQQDPFFEMYSSVDERSAAYMACGLAAESGEPVVLSCTGATAARNYSPALTEAFYRKLPVLAITSSQPSGRLGHDAQVTDRSRLLSDEARLSVELPVVHDEEDEWDCVTKVNRAILELTRDGGGPAHINLITRHSSDFSVKEIKPVWVLKRVGYEDELPQIEGKNVLVYVGAHLPWTDRLTKAVDAFCECYNGVVVHDHISNYRGKYGVDGSLLMYQDNYFADCQYVDLAVHIGETAGMNKTLSKKAAWRVDPNGELCDTLRKLRYVFAMEEAAFFERYVSMAGPRKSDMSYYREWKREDDRLRENIPELPFSNAWIAQQTLPVLPEDVPLHFGILNSLRAWDFFEAPRRVRGYCNTGGFGIDGCVSSLIGASLADPEQLYFGVVGDLAFFYDMNVLGNRHIGKNVRLLVVNNGHGFEMRYHRNPCPAMGVELEQHLSAAGHFGNQSPDLVKGYAKSLGFSYLSASTKEEFMAARDAFVSPQMGDKPILLEAFTQCEEEDRANMLIDQIAMRLSQA